MEQPFFYIALLFVVYLFTNFFQGTKGTEVKDTFWNRRINKWYK